MLHLWLLLIFKLINVMLIKNEYTFETPTDQETFQKIRLYSTTKNRIMEAKKFQWHFVCFFINKTKPLIRVLIKRKFRELLYDKALSTSPRIWLVPGRSVVVLVVMWSFLPVLVVPWSFRSFNLLERSFPHMKWQKQNKT